MIATMNKQTTTDFDCITTLFSIIRVCNLTFNNTKKEAMKTISKANGIITKATKNNKLTKDVIDIADITADVVGIVSSSIIKFDITVNNFMKMPVNFNDIKVAIADVEKCIHDINDLTKGMKSAINDINNAIKIHVNGL